MGEKIICSLGTNSDQTVVDNDDNDNDDDNDAGNDDDEDGNNDVNDNDVNDNDDDNDDDNNKSFTKMTMKILWIDSFYMRKTQREVGGRMKKWAKGKSERVR